MRMHGILVAALMGILGGYAGALIAQPTGGFVIDDNVLITDTAADALDVSGGAQFGSGDVALVGTDGKINGPLSSTILDDLDGANLTDLDASNLDSGTMPMARMPDNVLVDAVFDTDSTSTSSATTTWVDTGLSLTITVDNATNDVVLMAWQHVYATGGNVGCQLRFVRGTTALTTTATGAGSDAFNAPLAYEDANPGTGAHTYKTQLNRSGSSASCYTEFGSKQSVLWAYEVQD